MMSACPNWPLVPVPQLKSWELAKSEGSWSAKRLEELLSATPAHAAPPPICTGEERLTVSPRPRYPLLPLPHPHSVLSLLRARIETSLPPTSDHVASVPTCTGEERSTVSACPS